MQGPESAPSWWQYGFAEYGEFAAFGLAIFAAIVALAGWVADKKINRYESAINRARHDETATKLSEAATKLEAAEQIAAGAQRDAIEARRSYADTLARATNAERDAAEARRTQADTLGRAASAEKEAALAKERAAIVERQNLILAAQIEPRRLRPEEQVRLSTVTAAHTGKLVLVESYVLDFESFAFGDQIIQALKGSGLRVVDRRLTKQDFGGVMMGMLISGRDETLARDIRKALSEVPRLGVAAEGVAPPSPLASISGGVSGRSEEEPEVVVMIGVKPLPR